jgi:site-specific recombinase XerD
VRVDVPVLKPGAFGGNLAGAPQDLGGHRVTGCVPAVAGKQPLLRLAPETAPIEAQFCAQIFQSLRKPGVSPSALIFSTRNGSPLSRRNLLNRQLKPACKLLGLTGANWHWLRHAHATLLDSVGAPIGTTQALLGHESAETTKGFYLRSVSSDAQKAVDGVGEKPIGPKFLFSRK